MSIITAPRPKATRKPRPFSCSIVSLTIAINDVRYSVDQTDPGEFGSRAFRLCKHSGDHEVYDVVQAADGLVTCTCPSYTSTHAGTSSLCKHGMALVTLGLLPAPVAKLEVISDLPAVPAGPCCPADEPTPCDACVGPAAAESKMILDLDVAPIAECVCDGCQAGPDDAGADAPGEDEGVLSIPTLDAPAGPAADLWTGFDDDGTWDLGPAPVAQPAEWTASSIAREHLDRSGTLTLAELLDHQEAHYRTWGNAAGDLLASLMSEAAMKARMVGATTPREFQEGVAELDADARRQWEMVGEENARSWEPELTSAGRLA